MTSHRDQFSTHEKYDGGTVYLGDDFPLNIVGHGRVLIKFPYRGVKGISEFQHISGLAWKIISVSKLNDASV